MTSHAPQERLAMIEKAIKHYKKNPSSIHLKSLTDTDLQIIQLENQKIGIEETRAWVKTELQDLKKWRTCIKNHNHLDEDQCIYAITEEDLDRFVREKLE